MLDRGVEAELEKTFPSSLFRGFTVSAIQDDGMLSASAFEFKEFDGRGIQECSVNWNDDAGSLLQIAAQKKENGQKQFKYGACQISRAVIDRMSGLAAAIAAGFNYERKPVEGNPYHGNLLCKTELSRSGKKALCGMLAMSYDRLYTREQLDQICSGSIEDADMHRR